MSYIRGRETLSLSDSKVSKSYTFDPSSRTVIVRDSDANEVLLVVNLEDNIAIYNPLVPSLGGDQSGNQLTLNFDTTNMSSSDSLLVLYQGDDDDESSVNLFTEILYELKTQTKILKKIKD